MELERWLRSLGLEQYEAAFRQNAIDETVLPGLTAEDLKELGVGLVGHRRKLLDAIAALRTDASAKAALPDAVPTTHRSAKDTGERRQVTVMFSDLVGSTALAARMDPEDLRELISAYQKCVAETVDRFGGFVAKYMGDGVLVYFGYPQAHEDNAERAVRAGLALIAAVAGLKTRAPLQTRVGIATGLVVVGDLIGSGEAQERGIVGETPNLAARLQGIAEPDTVVIADDTKSLLGSLFELKDLGSKDLKGIAGPARAWAALRPSSVEGRFEALHTARLSALVGREEESDLLLRRWSRAKAGEGQVVLLSGEAGIGKSRLIAALLENVAAEPHMRLRYFCSPQRTDSTLHPIIGQVERAAGLTHDDTPQSKLDKLDTLLRQASTLKEDASFFADMLSLPNDGRYPTLELLPQQRRQRTMDALMSHMQGLAHQVPVLMIFEDAHWSDPTTLELFDRTVQRIAALRVLLVVTFRPEFDPPWIGRPYVTVITINRLAHREVGEMIDRVVGNKLLPATIKHDIIERADGIPLFVEEMTKAVLEAGSESESRRTVAGIPSPAMAVPPSLHASLLARLDRLGPAKEVAQIGATIGREFLHPLLAAVARKPAAELGSALDRLTAAGLLFRQGLPPHASYVFKHALVQDTAYGTLLREPRRALHARIAEVLENQFPEIAESQPEVVARHCTEAGLVERAAALWGKAGERSLARSALVEAVTQLTRALDQITSLAATPALRRERIKLQVALITSLSLVKGFASPESKTAVDQAHLLIEEAEALGEPPEDPLVLFSVMWAALAAHYVAFNGDILRDISAEFLALAEKQGTTAPLLTAHRSRATVLLGVGDIAESRSHYDRAIALYDPAQHRPLAARFGQDARVAILSYRSITQWILGNPEASLQDAKEALSGAREVGHAATTMYALTVTSLSHILCGNYPVADLQLDEAVALADEKGAMFWKVTGMVLKGCVLALTGKASDAAQMITAGTVAFRSTGATLWMPLYLSYLARAHAELGQFEDAWRYIGEAMTTLEATKERWCEAEINRVAGELALIGPAPDVAKAESYYERANAVARSQQAKSWELRADMSRARLWRDKGDRGKAREVLAPIYDWFTEGFKTLDLKEAKGLLNTLAQ